MHHYENTWGRYLSLLEKDQELIHPDDRAAFKKNLQTMFYCSDVNDEGYLLLKDAHGIYRVKPDLYTIVPKPIFNYGDKVRDKENPTQIGIIRNIEWHHNRNREYYNLSIEGRDSNQRYFSEMLELISKSS